MDYLGELIKQAVLLRRLENGSAARAVSPLSRTMRDLLYALDPASDETTDQAVSQFLQDARRRLPRAFEQARLSSFKDAVLIGEFQSQRIASAMQKAAGGSSANTLSRDRIVEILDGDAIEGFTARQWWTHNERRLQARIKQQVDLGRGANETAEQIKERIERYAFAPARRHAEALTRTFANNVANAAQWETAEANPHLTRGYRLLVTLDRSTSKICIAYAARNKVYPFAPSSPRPPFHFSCRTIIAPVLIGREKEEPGEAGDWLKRQPKEIQDEVLGPKRAALFRKGKLDLAELIRGDNTIATIEEIRGVASVIEFPSGPSKGSSQPPATSGPTKPSVQTAARARRRLERINRAASARAKSLDASLNLASAELARLFNAEGGFEQLFDEYNDLLKKRAALEKQRLDLMRRTLYVRQPAQVEWKTAGKLDANRQAVVDKGVAEFSKLVGLPIPAGKEVIFKPGGRGRAHYSLKGEIAVTVKSDVRMIIHELGHWLEDITPEVHQKALEFYDRRTAGEKLEWLGKGYRRNEKTRRDLFLRPYMGKEYKNAKGERYATEIVSMGVEYLYDDPFALAKDADYFDFIFDLLRGL